MIASSTVAGLGAGLRHGGTDGNGAKLRCAVRAWRASTLNAPIGVRLAPAMTVEFLRLAFACLSLGQGMASLRAGNRGIHLARRTVLREQRVAERSVAQCVSLPAAAATRARRRVKRPSASSSVMPIAPCTACTQWRPRTRRPRTRAAWRWPRSREIGQMAGGGAADARGECRQAGLLGHHAQFLLLWPGTG
ncbi:hypothetical protein ACTMU2_32240 [Cupriavidus basilensis]